MMSVSYELSHIETLKNLRKLENVFEKTTRESKPVVWGYITIITSNDNYWKVLKST